MSKNKKAASEVSESTPKVEEAVEKIEETADTVEQTVQEAPVVKRSAHNTAAAAAFRLA